MDMLLPKDISEDVKKSMNYHLEHIQRAVDSGDWLSAIPHLKILQPLIFLADLCDERAGRGRYNVPWMKYD